MAAAYSARQLGVPATIVVPSVTPNPTVERLKDEGATVIIHGKVSSHLSFPLCHFDARLFRFSQVNTIGFVLCHSCSISNNLTFSKTHQYIYYGSINVTKMKSHFYVYICLLTLYMLLRP